MLFSGRCFQVLVSSRFFFFLPNSNKNENEPLFPKNSFFKKIPELDHLHNSGTQSRQSDGGKAGFPGGNGWILVKHRW
jgi:hypothetical protein